MLFQLYKREFKKKKKKRKKIIMRDLLVHLCCKFVLWCSKYLFIWVPRFIVFFPKRPASLSYRMMNGNSCIFCFSFSIAKWRTSAVHVVEEDVFMEIAIVFISDSGDFFLIPKRHLRPVCEITWFRNFPNDDGFEFIYICSRLCSRKYIILKSY